MIVTFALAYRALRRAGLAACRSCRCCRSAPQRLRGDNANVLLGSAAGRPALRRRVQRDDLHGGLALHEAGVRLHDGLRVLRRLPAVEARSATITKYALLSIWWLNFAYGNSSGRAEQLLAVQVLLVRSARHPRARSPTPSSPSASPGRLRGVLEELQGARPVPSVNMVVPFVALYVWWLPITRQYEFYFLLTPLFHSLQYLAFVYKMEDTRLRGLSHPEIRGTILAVGGIVLAGWLAFEFLPNERRHRARHVQLVADVLLLHRGDVVHQHPPLLHRQRPLALQGPRSPEISVGVGVLTPNLQFPTPKGIQLPTANSQLPRR